MNLVKPGIFKDKLSSRRMETNLADNTYFELHDTQDDNLQSEKNNVFKCLGKKDANQNNIFYGKYTFLQEINT